MTLANGLQRAFPFVPLFRAANVALTRLVEVHADDRAVMVHDRRVLATALIELAVGRSPAGSLSATGASTVDRVRRLTAPPGHLGRPRAILATAAVAALLVVPVVLATLPALTALAMHLCPVPWPGGS